AAQAAAAGDPAPSRPVLMWVHSGGYSDNSGSSPSINGARIAAEQDLVVVSFNHRLGVLGYTQVVDPVVFPDSPYASSGNVGQLDIIAALEWVRDNIAAFGGDPQQVTLAGQSGGAMKISVLLAMPAAQPLFRAALLQSGTTTRVAEPDEALAVRDSLLTRLGLDRDEPECLATTDLAELMRAYRDTSAGPTVFGPVRDGVTLPFQPFDDQAVALSGDKPLIIGDMDTEAALFLSRSREDLLAAGADGVAARLASAVGHEVAGRLLAGVRARMGELDGYELAVQLSSDGWFAGPAHAACLRRTRGASAPTWRYRNALRTPAEDGILMSPHELDVALTFGNIETATGLNGDTPAAHEVSRLLRSTWAAFVRTGCPDNKILGSSVPSWPAYAAEGRQVLVIDAPAHVEANVDGEALDVAAELAQEHIDWFTALLRDPAED
ncbi:MAG: putative carboxylesterase, partial [Actinomyces urogenitalis DORA_12]